MTPDELLAEHTAPIVELTNELRRLLRDAMPHAQERVYPGWHGFGFVHPDAGYVAAVFPGAETVKLLFEHGHLLEDTAGIFTGGTGQTRHVELAPGDKVPVQAILDLLSDAIDLKAAR